MNCNRDNCFLLCFVLTICFQIAGAQLSPWQGVSRCDWNSYECKNGKCIAITSWCDGIDDCGDNSDETNTLCTVQRNCSNHQSPSVFFGRTKRVVQGSFTRRDAWPWNVQMKSYKSFEGKLKYKLCGASLITDTWVMTAAHCFRTTVDYRQLVLGEYDMTIFEGTEYIKQVVEVVTHPLFDSTTYFSYDIALLRMDSPTYFNPSIQPACLPRPLSIAPLESPCIATGWGNTGDYARSNIMKEIPYTLTNTSPCTPGSTKMCVITTPGTGLCFGDSGGPFMCKNEQGAWIQEGIMSYMTRCGTGRPEVMSRVSELMSFITRVVG